MLRVGVQVGEDERDAGARGTLIDHTFDGGPETGETVDGNSIGLAVGVRPR